MPEEVEIDALGLLCPLPVLRVQKRMRQLRLGDIVRVTSDDPAALVDIPHFCSQKGHKLLKCEAAVQGHIFVIQKL